MSWYKSAKNDIYYLGDYNYFGDLYVHFKVGEDYWLYRLRFPDVLYKIKKLAHTVSQSKAFEFAKKNKIGAFKVSKDWPLKGGIEREEFSQEEIQERANASKSTPKPVQQELNF